MKKRYLGAAVAALGVATCLATPAMAESGPRIVTETAKDCVYRVQDGQGPTGGVTCALGGQNRVSDYAGDVIDGTSGSATANSTYALIAEAGDQIYRLVGSAVEQVDTLSETLGEVSVGTQAGHVGIAVKVAGVSQTIVLPTATPSSGEPDFAASSTGSDSTNRMTLIFKRDGYWTRDATGGSLDGIAIFRWYRGQQSDEFLYYGSSQTTSITPRNGAKLKQIESRISVTGGMGFEDFQPNSVDSYGSAGSRGISAGVSVGPSNAKVNIGLSRTWNIPEGQAGGGFSDQGHYAIWAGKSGAAKSTDGVETWSIAPNTEGGWTFGAFAIYQP